MATTFATNHIRQIAIALAKSALHRNAENAWYRKRLLRHLQMLLFFLAGAALGTVFCHLFSGRAIWVTLLPFGVVFIALLHADRTSERELLAQKPAGH